MSINYNDTRRRETKRGKLGPALAVIVIVGALLWFGPQITGLVEDALNTLLALPR
jgi:hypothetical protein